ncbi:hypothetical protein N656DRAFT_783032 [Canariomyces notabilis]|uniref:PXA domain-containing protein n=1 Tax=Canariomyces notabilis TaxID=2074819 RepID=A0AAN6QJZ7_9PEZI|nr:hypothetical protein N656DRAFT_783032 [Canariomyces arenarius]
MDEKTKTEPDTVDTGLRAAPSQTTDHVPTAPSTSEDGNLATKIIQFIATATPGTLGVVAVGLAAITYLVLGRLGLVLIGAFGGIVTFIHWEQRSAEVQRTIRGERGVDVLARLLEAKKNSQNAMLNEPSADEQETALVRSFDDLRPETREAMNELVDAVIENYVKWWYSPIVPSDKSFPLVCRKTLTSFLTSVCNSLSRKRPADAFLDFLTNSSSIVIVFFSELSNAYAEVPAESKVSAADAVYNYLASHPESNLSNLLNQRQQAGKFRMAAEDLLGFLERPIYECDPARVFLREILAGVILEMTLQTCSKPEFINSWIVYLLESGEPDISQAIDVGMQTGPSADAAFADLDGNVGNIGLTKGNRNSFEQERARRRESTAHKKKLSKAEEEMEVAMEEMKRLNQMIANEGTLMEESQQGKECQGLRGGEVEASERLADALKRNADELDIQEGWAPKPVQPEHVDSPADMPQRASSDDSSRRNGAIPTPVTPLSAEASSSQGSSPPQDVEHHFTSFDQIVPPARDEPEGDAVESPKPPLTLHNATITVLDEPGDGRIRSKPSWDYLVQIEPATTMYPGWMIVRKYSDFEVLHEVLRRIANVSGATAFSEQHKTLPPWKVHTRTSLRGELERYLRDACWHQSLAESEGLKKFLERDHGHIPSAKSGFQAFEKIGKNVLDVLTSAPLEGSKAVVGGVTGVLGNIGLGQRKAAQPTPSPPPSALQDVTAASRLSISALSRADSSLSLSGMRKPRDSIDSQHSSVIALQPGKIPPMERRPSYNSQGEAEPENAGPSRASARNSREHSRASSRAPGPGRSPSSLSFEGFRLPPPPDMIPDDYGSPTSPSNTRAPDFATHHMRSLTMPTISSNQQANGPPLKGVKQHPKLSEQETRVAVELIFAVINELYTLSSAWNIRRTLLAAAKSFLLRPGNPSLLSIQSLIQSSVLEANTSDSGIAAHVKKLRENALPTEQERAAWPAEMTADEKEKLRVKARKLLIESGVPAALMGVMGQAATSEALGRLFDCLQIEEVARGLMFGVLLQAVRTVTH